MKKLKARLQNLDYNNLYPLFFTIIFILILIQYSFNSLDAIFHDLWVRANFLDTVEEEIILVHMDEESDQFLGEVYPYTQATHSRFIDRVVQGNPKAIGYLVPIPDPETPREAQYVQSFVQAVRQYDKSGGIFRFGTTRDTWGEQIPTDSLRDLGYSLALINKDGNTFAQDDVTRRAILNFSGEDSFHLWMSNQIREASNQASIDATSFSGAYYNSEADAIFSLFKYSEDPNEGEKIKTIPFHRIVVGNYPQNFFKNKIVLVGSRYYSHPGDYTDTPFGKGERRASKLNIHGQIIEALMKNKTVAEVPNWITDLFAILIAAFLSFIISRVQPTKGLLITMSIMLFTFALSFALYLLAGYLLHLSHIILSIFVVYYIWVPFRAIGEYQSRYAIEEETKVLKKVDMLKQNFISLMSHDLKTPVAKIVGITDILKNQFHNNDEQAVLLNNLTDSTKELNNFITSILDLTKIESQDLDIKFVSKDINTILEESIAAFRFEAQHKQMLVEYDLAPLYPIKMDPVLINRVFSNLIGNAIKYAGEGKKISIKSWDDEKWVYVEISDSGQGIREEDLEHIFEKFYRVKNNENHQIKGSGLGLYLVKYFVELHKGEIIVSSEVGEGTKFVIKFKNE